MITTKNKSYYFFVLLLIFITLVIITLLFLVKKSQQIKISSPRLTPTLVFTKNSISLLTPTLRSTPIPTKIPSPTIIPTTIRSTGFDEMFSKYAKEYNVDEDLLKKIARCESSFNPNASTSLYAGLFQFSESLWVNTRTFMGQNSDIGLRFNAEESIRTAAYLLGQGRYSLWPSCYY